MVSHRTDRQLLFSAEGTVGDRADQSRRQRVRGMLMQHPDGPAILGAIDKLDASRQQFVIHWIDVIARSDSELARVFAARAPAACRQMERTGVEAWVIRAMDTYDKRGLGQAIAVFEDHDGFAADYAERHSQACLAEQQAVLQPYIVGLGGRPLTVAHDETADSGAYTDSESIYLPARLRRFNDPELNRRLLLAQAVFLWAQNRYGTWRLQSLERLATLPAGSEQVYATLERFRIEACLERDLPGIHRHLSALQVHGQETVEPSPAWQQARDELAREDTTSADSLDLIAQLRNEPLPPPACYQGRVYPDRVQELVRKRVARERQHLQKSLDELQQSIRDDGAPRQQDGETGDRRTRQGGESFSVSQAMADNSTRQRQPQLEYQGRKVKTPSEVQGLLTSIEQDLGEVPDDYLAGGGNDTPYDADAEQARDREYTAEPLHYAEGALSYPEWDFNRQRYRADYCLLREQPVAPGDPAFIHATLQKYRGPLKSIRRSFEAVLGEDRLLKRQPDGDEIDIDALIEAQADATRGVEMDERVYSRHRRIDRDIAVMIMVDMSGSTRGWVNDAERESLVLLCEALETLGDRYAIYGFSGRTHTRCAIYPIKRFNENYNQSVRERISGIKPQTYTRMGVAIRHLGGLLGQVPARTKLLVTLSDGKPEDYGSYRGRYGIEDTRRALLETRRDGIHAFCITIDQAGGDYLPHMYGPANYAVIDRVSQLPLKVAAIYRRLTT